ncbi:MAG TPA: hypothetical protein VMF88_08235 [Bacteroidota bacterium]|nr:hypothetical protein [Bacteroidota bacterium]
MHQYKKATGPLIPLLRFAAAGTFAILFSLFPACKDSSNSVSALDQIVFPATGISYEKQVQPLFNVGCATTSCHDSQDAKLNLTSYGLWKLDPGVIVDGDSTNSRFVWCIEAKAGSPPMPPARPLVENQIQGLKQWIHEGAKDTK